MGTTSTNHKPGKYAIHGVEWSGISNFGDRKISEPFVPKAVVTDKGNIVTFDRLDTFVGSGPVGNEAVLYDRVAEPVPNEVYETFEKCYKENPPIVLNRQFDSMRNASELMKHLQNPNAYGIVSGRKPSGPCHFGHKLVIETIGFFQKNGAQIFVPIADNEARLDSKVKSEQQYKYFTADNLLDWGASGLNLDAAHVYLQSEEVRVMNISYAVARKLDMQLALDVYGRETFVDEMNFLFASLTQVGDILLPQHPDFGKTHSFMLSGADQDGNMSMTTTLSRRVLDSSNGDPGSARYINTAPSSLYIRSISNLEGKKESASEPETTIYLGPSRNVYGRTETGGKIMESIRILSLDDRVADTAEKVDRFSSIDNEKVMAAIRRRQPLFREFKGEKDMTADRFKHKVAEVLEAHQERRGRVFEYAVLEALEGYGADSCKNSAAIKRLIRIGEEKIPGFNRDRKPAAPTFWEAPSEANVPKEKRNVKTEWFYLVAEAAESLIA